MYFSVKWEECRPILDFIHWIDCIVIWYKLEEIQMMEGVKTKVFLTSAKKEFQRWSKLIFFDLALQQFVFGIMRTKKLCTKSPEAAIKRANRARYYDF